MSVGGSGASLAALTKDLARKWAETKEAWLDAKSDEFEQRFMSELFASINRTVASVQELDKTIAQVTNDCK